MKNILNRKRSGLMLANLFLSFLLLLLCLSDSRLYPDDAKEYHSLEERVRNEFDWRAYFELYPDVAKHYKTREDAMRHYMETGSVEKRKFPKLYPTKAEFRVSQKKVRQFLKKLEANNVPLQKRYFVIYFLDDLDRKYSLEVAVNSLKLFNYSIHNGREMNSNVFYWFNVVRGFDNVLLPYVPYNLPNVAYVSWDYVPSDIFNHFRTLSLLKYSLSNFGSITFLNQNVRGPLSGLGNTQWIVSYASVLFSNGNAMVSNVLNCEKEDYPLFDINFFMIRKSTMPVILREFMSGSATAFPQYSLDKEISLRRKYEMRLSEVIYKNQGLNITSYYDYHQHGLVSYEGKCPHVLSSTTGTAESALQLPGMADNSIHSAKFSKLLKIIQSEDNKINGETLNPYDINYRCALKGKDVVFMKWGGDFTHYRNLVCDEMITRMTNTLLMIQKNSSNAITFFIPETLQGGYLKPLYYEYDLEMWRESLRFSILSSAPETATKEEKEKLLASYYKLPSVEDDNVCFLIRTSAMHDNSNAKFKPLVDRVVDDGIDGIIRCEFPFCLHFVSCFPYLTSFSFFLLFH
jgi:hypothetical protein